MPSLKDTLDYLKDAHLDDSPASGVEAIYSKEVDGKTTIVFAFANEASRDKKTYPGNHTIEGYPVSYEYDVKAGPGAVIDPRFGM